MKLTINVDEKLMAKVLDVTCARNEEEAITAAMQNTAELEHMKAFFAAGPHMTGEELGASLAPDYEPNSAYSPNRSLSHLPSYENAAPVGQ